MSGRLKAYCCLSAAMVIVGSSVVVGRIAALRLPVFLALGLRFAVACLLVLPLLRRREGGLPRLSVRHWAVLFGQTFCGVFLFNVLLLHGLRLTGAATAGIVTSTTPAWMGLLPWPSWASGRAAGLLGILPVRGREHCAVTFQGAAPDATQEAQPLLGGLLALGAVLGEACFLLLRKALPASLSGLGAAAAVSLLVWPSS
jgi:drug/metabolite transporter (DMT)-like permease